MMLLNRWPGHVALVLHSLFCAVTNERYRPRARGPTAA
ncbi:hypothetical protein BJ992_003237 [Sphaerisporangium rubeum]|uniref:Uncharacterized protein n=1 Tax=Sphaerisporangium rubeum TaxID=321317 RepID=A0A7X0IER3_9ACTN|nr:hypothetical protein [Sphaerisporangium rubeum]